MFATRCLLRYPPNDSLKARLLSGARSIAVVGYSRSAWKDSTVAANCLHNAGFNVVGVNPTATNVDQQPASVPMVASLKAASRLLAQQSGAHESTANHPAKHQEQHPVAPIDIVSVYRDSSALPEVAAEIKRMPIKPKAVWLHRGVSNPAVEEELEQLGITVVANRCLLSEHIRLCNMLKDDGVLPSLPPEALNNANGSAKSGHNSSCGNSGSTSPVC